MPRKKKMVSNIGSTASSSHLGSSGIVGGLQPSIIERGVCRDELITRSGKRMQLAKMLCLNVLPIIGLWAYTVYTLADNIGYREEYLKRRESLSFSIDLGKLVHRLQVERDMSVLYISAIGPDTKSFLLAEYENTDNILDEITWAEDIDDVTQNPAFASKDIFLRYLNKHRQKLDSNTATVQDEIDFYSKSIDVCILWLYNTITESKFSLTWRLLVAYQKLASAKENLGVERALGTMFFARGGFDDREYFENFNRRLHSFLANMKSIGMYSDVVDQIYTRNKLKFPNNFIATLGVFREEIQTSNLSATVVNVRKARLYFDNMTIYLDVLFDTQSEMGSYVIVKFDSEIDLLTRDLTLYAILLVIVILICPVVIIATENLTSSIQKYAITLVDKTQELKNEKKRTESLLYQMVPKQVAEILKRKRKVDAEFFKQVTVAFADIYDFDRMLLEMNPMDIVELLNTLYTTIDEILDDFDIYKVETINDCYMVASGLPKRNRDRHSYEIAQFALKVVKAVSSTTFLSSKLKIQLRVGVNTGPCMAGIVGSLMPRYCLFGDTINTASRMKAYSEPNSIHISNSTYHSLKKFKSFSIRTRGSVSVKGKGEMKTYWLLGSKTDSDSDIDAQSQVVVMEQRIRAEKGETRDISSLDNYASQSFALLNKPEPSGKSSSLKDAGSVTTLEETPCGREEAADVHKDPEFPGEIKTLESPTYSAALLYPMPGRQK